MTNGMVSHAQCVRGVDQLSLGPFAGLVLLKLSLLKRVLMRAINLIFLRTLTDIQRGKSGLTLLPHCARLSLLVLLMISSIWSIADITFVPVTDTYPGSVVDSSSCTKPPQTIYFEFSTLDEVLQLFLRTKVSASNCTLNQVWYYDYIRTEQIGPSSWKFWGRSQYDGSVSDIGVITARHNCPGEPNVGSLTCPITCPSSQLMINGSCQQPKMTATSCVGNPVIVATGNKIQIELDYQGAAEGGVAFKRYYNSLRVVGSITSSYTWRRDYDQYVFTAQTLGGQTLYNVSRPNADHQQFIVSGGTVIPRDPDNTSRLSVTTNNTGGVTGWTFYDASRDSVEVYDASGKLLSITNRAGLAQTLTYSDGTSGANGGYVLDDTGNPTTTVLPTGLLIRVVDASGRRLSFGYDANNRIVKMLDPASGLF